ncbi:hypothetical protein EMMF5_001598 [Cystobasidiomycetes sp. EMM_F5]
MISSYRYYNIVAVYLVLRHAAGLHFSVAASSHNPAVPAPHIRRSQHAKLAARLQLAQQSERRGLSTLVSGTGDGTFYYDVNGAGTCGPVNGVYSFPETHGIAMCEPYTKYKNLAQRNSNKVVAISASAMRGNLAQWCGKEVVISYKGNTIGGFVLWDGCASCDSTNGIDLSSTEFGNLIGAANCGMGRVGGVSWKVTSNQLWDYPTGNPVNRGVDSNDNNHDDKPVPASSSSSHIATPVPSTSHKASSTAPTSTVLPDEPSSTSFITKSTSSTARPSSSSQAPASEKPVLEPSSSSSSTISTRTRTRTRTSLSSTSTLKPSISVPTSSDAPDSTSSTTSAPVRTITRNLIPVPILSGSASDSDIKLEPTLESKSPSNVLIPSPTTSPAQASTSPQAPLAGPSDNSDEEGSLCNATPGAWRCAASSNNMQQCIYNEDGTAWVWTTRVVCGSKPLNCGTPVPVCADPISGQ